MFSDVFSKEQALALIKGKKIWFIGSSNMRAIYKDLLWLITHGDIAIQSAFKVKNESSYLNDRRLTNDKLHNGVNYVENREFRSKDVHLYFHFITRLYLDHFIKLINGITEENCPDVILLNSCLWDMSRWGGDGARNYRQNLMRTMMLLKSKLPPKVKVIWKTALPVSVTANGAIFTDIKHIVPVLPWFIQQANLFASKCASFFNFDTLDLHYYMRLQGHLHVKDGIHWRPNAVRYLTNIFLTHVCLSLEQKLPGNFIPSQQFLIETTKKEKPQEIIKKRVEEKAVFFKKLFAATDTIAKKAGKFQSGIKNVVVKASKKVFNAKNLKRKLKSVAKQCFNKNTGQYDLNQARSTYASSPIQQLDTYSYYTDHNQRQDQQYDSNYYNFYDQQPSTSRNTYSDSHYNDEDNSYRNKYKYRRNKNRYNPFNHGNHRQWSYYQDDRHIKDY